MTHQDEPRYERYIDAEPAECEICGQSPSILLRYQEYDDYAIMLTCHEDVDEAVELFAEQFNDDTVYLTFDEGDSEEYVEPVRVRN